jgi:hypothetical protein
MDQTILEPQTPMQTGFDFDANQREFNDLNNRLNTENDSVTWWRIFNRLKQLQAELEAHQ